MPRDGRSARYSLPGHCLQHVGGTSFLISFARFSTNSFHSFSVPLIQYSATFESVYQQIFFNSTSGLRATDTLSISLLEQQFQMGSFCLVVEETVVLDATKLTALLDSLLTFRYMTAAYAPLEALQNCMSSMLSLTVQNNNVPV